MPIMTWDSSLDIGVEAMNREHQDILDLMNEIFDIHKAGGVGDAIVEPIARLGDVCQRHFASEEAFMTKVGYPGLETHQALHRKLLGRFTEHADAIQAAGGKADDEFFYFLRTWLKSHIMGVDAKYGEHVNAKSAA